MSARSSCAPAPISTAKRAPADLRRPLEIEDAEPGAEVPVRLGLEVEGPRLAPCANDDVVGGALAHGTLSCGRLGIVASSRLRCCSMPSSSISSCLIFCARSLFASKIGWASSPWRLARATSSPAAFCSRLRPSTCGISRRRVRFERGELFELVGKVDAARLQPLSHGIDVVAEIDRIQHAGSRARCNAEGREPSATTMWMESAGFVSLFAFRSLPRSSLSVLISLFDSARPRRRFAALALRALPELLSDLPARA